MTIDTCAAILLPDELKKSVNYSRILTSAICAVYSESYDSFFEKVRVQHSNRHMRLPEVITVDGQR